MSTYISSYSVSNALRQSVLTAQSQLSIAEQEQSSGTYADIGLQLGQTTNQDLTLRSEQSLFQTYTDTNNSVSTRLSSTQNVLSQLQTTAQNFLNTLISSSDQNGTGQDLQSAAATALQSLTTQLNTSVSGQYIFAGINTGTSPLTNYYATGSANQAATAAAFQANFGFSQSSASVSSITGSQMQSFLTSSFAPLFSGSNWTSNWSSASDTPITSQISETQNVTTSVSANDPAFQDLAQAYTMVADLGAQNLSYDALNAVISQATSLVQSGITGLTQDQTNLGLTQNDVTSANNQMSVQLNILSTQISGLESVDPYQVSTQVTSLQTQIETAYSLTAQLQKMSLVNYI
ncbi:MAG: flagellar hook-associated family protein [Methylovirgula sp.]